jgi:DNA-binding beta-propeller fold protein YncE
VNPPAWNTPEAELIWPLPPEPPRIEYRGFIRSAADLGRQPGLLQRVASVLFGEDETEMLKPVAVAKNRVGMLVVADPGVPTLHFFDLEERRYRRLEEKLASQLRSPVGVAIDDSGRVYVSDSVRRRVFVLEEGRRLVAELGAGLLERPTGLALSPAQDLLYVVDTTSCRVVVFDRAGSRVGGFGKRGVEPGEFNSPTHISTAPDGTISVSDSLNYRVQRFRPDGALLAGFGRAGDGAGTFARPKGLAADAWGRTFVVDAAFENVQIFDSGGALLLAFGASGSGPGEFLLPSGLFLDSSNTIWVADSFNRRIQVFRLFAENHR